MNYRWFLRGADGGNRWLNGLGTFAQMVADADDFVITVAPPGPDWHLGSVVYEIFPDRFAASGAEYDAPDWAVRREWDELPDGRWNSQYEWFGGDLPGIAARLDHIESLGASVVYLTPIFPAGTVHRYDANTFEHIDPLLGGDEGLVTLTKAAHERGIRVVGDLTLNHVGSGHEWFRTAVEDPDSPERELLLLRRVARQRLRRVDGGAASPQARLPLAGTSAADERRRRPLDAAALRARRVAHRRGEHDRALPRHRRQSRGGARQRGQRSPPRARRGSSSPSTCTTPGTTSAPAAGRAS